MRPPVSLALASCVACTVPNPAFDIDSDSTHDPATSTPATSAATSTTTGTTDEPTPTGEPATTGGPAPTTGSVDPGTTGTTDTTDTSSESGDDSTGGALDCWAQGADGWPVGGTELTNFADMGASDPFITPDGLRIYYVALDERRPFLSTRGARDQPFPNGAQLAVWNNEMQYAVAHPALVLGETEMLMANNYDVAFSLAQPNEPDKFSKPAVIGGTNTPYSEDLVTASADGEVLIVSRLDGDPLPPFYPEKSPRFHQFTRTDPAPGDPFTGDKDVTPVVGTLHLAVCPVLSPDGLHLFFASTEAQIIVDNTADETVNIYYTSRADRDAAWGPIGHLPIANAGNGVTCPSSVTADGCELAYIQFKYKGDGYRMFVATRNP